MRRNHPLFGSPTLSRFQITSANFFPLARLADKFIIPHLTSLLQYYSGVLIKEIVPNFELWLDAARHEMMLIEKACRSAARPEVARLLSERGISYFIVDKGIPPIAMDGIIIELLRQRDDYLPYRQVIGGKFYRLRVNQQQWNGQNIPCIALCMHFLPCHLRLAYTCRKWLWDIRSAKVQGGWWVQKIRLNFK